MPRLTETCADLVPAARALFSLGYGLSRLARWRELGLRSTMSGAFHLARRSRLPLDLPRLDGLDLGLDGDLAGRGDAASGLARLLLPLARDRRAPLRRGRSMGRHDDRGRGPHSCGRCGNDG